ncbi:MULTISPECIES: hypothetical protein [Nocardia]|nr:MULTISPECIES: hypothetical protein [Nocardia]
MDLESLTRLQNVVVLVWFSSYEYVLENHTRTAAVVTVTGNQ